MQSFKGNIFVGSKVINKIGSLIDFTKYTRALIVTDKNIPNVFVKNLQVALPIEASIVYLEGGEQYKNLKSVQEIWKSLIKGNYDRKSVVVNLGGGVIGDVGGFAASTFMRGIDFVQIPTTLLAQVDAGIGGKVGINFLGGKNLIGSFQEPAGVIIDIDTLESLPEREFLSGFAEIIKHGAIADRKYFQFVTSKKPLDFSRKELMEVIKGSLKIKMRIVSKDKKEKGLRKLLNFGHTIGHAVESLSQKTQSPLSHGEAVSIGMAAEGKISNLVGLLSNEDYENLKQSLAYSGLPTTMPPFSTSRLLGKMKSDKKNKKGKINWTLLKNIGEAVVDQDVNNLVVRKVL